MEKLAEFEAYQLRRGLRSRTIKSNVDFIKGLPLGSEREFNDFLLKKLRVCKASYVNRLIYAVKVYGEFSNCQWMKDLKRVRDKLQPRKATLSDDQIEQFLAVKQQSASYQSFYDMMDVFWHIMAFTGMRTVEVAELKREDIDLGRNCFMLGDTKTGLYREIPIPEPISQLLKDHLLVVKDLLFPSRQNKKLPINHHVWGKSFRRRLELANIDRIPGLTPYSIRHTFGTRMLSENGAKANLFDVQAIMGHTDSNTTAQYYHGDLESRRKAIARLPIARKNMTVRQFFEELRDKLREITDPLSPDDVQTQILESEEEIELVFKVKIKKEK